METRVRSWMLFLVFGLCAAAARAAEAPVARFAGRVVDAEGRPVAGARVWLRVDNTDRGAPFLARNLGVTDEGGRFAVEVPQTWLPYGESTTRPWPKRWRYLVAAWEPGRGLGWARGEPGAKVEIRMTRPAVLRGRVLDADGVPQSGVEVSIGSLHFLGKAGDEDDLDYSASPDPLWTRTSTDAEGRFEFAGLPAGASTHVSIEQSGPRGSRWPDQWSLPKEVTLSEQTTDLTIKLMRMSMITGRLLMTDGTPPATRIGVELRGEVKDFGAVSDWGSTDEQGRYRFDHVRPGRYLVWVYGGEYAPAVAENVEVGEDQQVELPTVVLRRESAWVEGRVLDANTGEPLAGVNVRAYRRDRRYRLPPVMVSGANTDDDGRYRLAVPAAEVIVHVFDWRQEWVADYTVEPEPGAGETRLRFTREGRKPDSLPVHPKPDETVSGVDLYVRRGVDLYGLVVGPDGKPWVGGVTYGGRALPGAMVEVTRDRDRVEGEGAWMPGAIIMEDGTFHARGLYAGVPVVVSAFDGDLEVGGAVCVTLREGEPNYVVLRLGPAARVRGRVVLPDGKPAAGVTVGVNAVSAGYGRTDAEGRFDRPGGVPGLPCAVTANGALEPDRKHRLQGTSKTVEVAPGQNVVDVGDIVLALVEVPPLE